MRMGSCIQGCKCGNLRGDQDGITAAIESIDELKA